MQMVAISAAKGRLSELTRVADDEPVFLLRHSKPAAVLLSANRYEELQDRLEDLEDTVAVLQHELHPEPTITLEDLRAELGVGRAHA